MVKGRLFVGALSFVSLTGVVIACGDDEGSTFGPETVDSGSGDSTTGVFNPDTGTSSDAPSNLTCIPDIPANFAAQWNPPTAGKVCSKAVLDEYYDKCLANSTKPDGGGTPCEVWRAANANCGKCIEQDKNAGPIAIVNDGNFKLINFSACIAVAQNKLAATDCGAEYNAAVSCTRAACDGCFAKGGGISEFNVCQNAAKTKGLCKSLDDQIASGACKGYKDANAPALACFDGPIGQKSQVTKLLGVVCGDGT